MILIGGQRSRTATASFNPSIQPGMSISVGNEGCDGGIGMFSLENFKARIFQFVNNRHSYERFVFDNENGDTMIHFHTFLLDTDPFSNGN
ncbi:hypothetical protein [Rhizobium tubonense]|uniref:hypothetical protein n=1 Tax=Rhizobium tubonense TaxID=484088 RepID=UPI0018A86B67